MRQKKRYKNLLDIVLTWVGSTRALMELIIFLDYMNEQRKEGKMLPKIIKFKNYNKNGEKLCTSCKRFKSVDQFYKSGHKGGDGLYSKCKLCYRDKQRKDNIKNGKGS